MKKLILAFFSTLILAVTINTQADQLIIEPDMGREPILNAIQSTKHSLNLVMYGLTDKTLLDAIIKQKQRGRTVKIILESEPYKIPNENNAAIAALHANHIHLIGKIPPYRLIHQKTLLVDNKNAIVMTFNFTHSSFKKTRNFGLILDDPSDIKEIADHFSADWNQHATTGHSKHLVWSPDNSRNKIIALIKQAKHSILIYAQSVSDYKVIGELAKAAERGITVNILTSNKPKKKMSDHLKRAGANIRLCRHYYIHAKAMLIDNQQALIGSTNLTRASLDDNRELSVISSDKKVIRELAKTFHNDWRQSV